MIASLLSPSSSSNNQPARISQLLPTVKCSTCHKPVPLDELGDHTCTAPPPVPALPKPAFTPEGATALLPDRLQGRVANGPPNGAPSSPRAPPQGQAPAPIPSSSSASRLRINVNAKGPPSPTQPSFQPRSSPLARADSSQSIRIDARSPQPRAPPYAAPSSASSSHSYASSSSAASPLHTRPPPGTATIPNRMRTPSNAASLSNQSTPSTARPSNSFLDSPSTTPVQAGRPVSPNINSNPNSTPRGPPNAGIPFPTSNSYPNRTGSAPPLNLNNNNGPYPNGNYRPGPQISGPVGPPIARPSPPPHSVSEPNFNNNNSKPDGSGSNSINRNNTLYRQNFVPPAERGIDTKTGGEAGMAGVGRRGFAAAARAAMFVNPQSPGRMQGPGPGGRLMGPQPMQGRGMGPPGPAPGPGGYRPMPPPNMAPRLLDTDSIPRCKSLIEINELCPNSLIIKHNHLLSISCF